MSGASSPPILLIYTIRPMENMNRPNLRGDNMNKAKKIIGIAGAIMLIAGHATFGEGKGEETIKTGSFSRKEVVNISTASGKIDIKADNVNNIEVVVAYTYSPDRYDPQFIEKNGELLLREEFNRSNSRGRATWTVTVPKGTQIVGNSASGSITVRGLEEQCNLNTASGKISVSDNIGDVGANTASGKIEINDLRGNLSANSASGNLLGKNVDGNVSANSASGRIELDGVAGMIDLNTASGKISAQGIVIGHHSSISTASGSISITLSQSAEYDLSVNTASGNAVVDYRGNKVAGFFEFEARQDRGRIISPFKFDNETTFVESGHTYDRKSFTRDSDTPKSTLSTSSGTVELKR